MTGIGFEATRFDCRQEIPTDCINGICDRGSDLCGQQPVHLYIQPDQSDRRDPARIRHRAGRPVPYEPRSITEGERVPDPGRWHYHYFYKGNPEYDRGIGTWNNKGGTSPPGTCRKVIYNASKLHK